MIASYARFGPIPLLSGRWVGRGIGPSLADNVGTPVLRWQSAGAGAWGLLAVEAPRDRSCA
ncbi:MAG: hypothetical protein ACOYLU_01025, partial [Limisphaerales bacterium]